MEICAAYPGLESRARLAPKARVVVTVAWDDLSARVGHGATPYGDVVAPASVRRLACDAGIIPMVLGSASQVLDVGREERLATAAQQTVLWRRDGGCSFPGCSRPPGWCRAHHIVHWADGGRTDVANLALLCERHHTVVHQRGYTATVTDGGVSWQIGDRPGGSGVKLGPSSAGRAR